MKKALLFLSALFLLSISVSASLPGFTGWKSGAKDGATVKFRIQDDVIDDGYALCEVTIDLTAYRATLTESVRIQIKEDDGAVDPNRYEFTVNVPTDGYSFSYSRTFRALISEFNNTEYVYADVHCEGFTFLQNKNFKTSECQISVQRNGDPYDPNDSRPDATNIISTTALGSMIIDNDRDYFKIYVSSSEPELYTRIRYKNDYNTSTANLDLDLFVYDANGAFVASSTSSSTSNTSLITEEITKVLQSGYYYIRVNPKSGYTSRNFYEFYATTSPAPDLTISGSVKLTNGTGVANVKMAGFPSTTYTNSSGNYSCDVPYGWSGTITPIKAAHTFSPYNKTYSNVDQDLSNQNYSTAGAINAVISGRVQTSNGTRVSNVLMSGFPTNVYTNSSGDYTASVPYGWSGTVKPKKSGYTFSPSSLSYSNTTSNKYTNYTATIITYTISGSVITTSGSPISGVTMLGLPGNPDTDNNGHYSVTVNYGWSGTVEPLKYGYSFSPETLSYNNVTSHKSYLYTGEKLIYAIQGFVETSSGVGIAGVTMSGLPGNPVTSSSGHYLANVDYGWDGTAVPTKSTHNFSPSSKSYSNVKSDQNTNYIGTPKTSQISGYVRTSSNSGISGVIMSGLPGNPSTNSNGYYSVSVNYGWSGTVTPSKSGYDFSPSSKSYSNVSSNQSTNYTGTLRTYKISGYVKTSSGSGISGVTMSGLSGSSATSSSGYYSVTVNYGWSGTVTPMKTGYNFNPSSKYYSSVTSNQSTNYTGVLNNYTISGYVRTSSGSAISGVTMSGLPGNPVTSSSGYYSVSVTYGWSGTVTPTKTGYIFNPSSKYYSSVSSNQSTNYTGTLRTYSISGYVRTSGGAAISSVSMSGLPGSPSTNSSGYYSATVNYGWSGTVSPTKAGYDFSPSAKSYSSVSSMQSTNYTGTIRTYTISGYVKTSGGAAISGVSLSGLPGSPSTNSSGYYSTSVNHGWSGTVSPTKAGYDFSPSSKSYSNISNNQTINYTATLKSYTISGYVKTSGGAAISGVSMSGLTGSPSTNSSGFYSATVNYGWGGTVTPTKAGYNFSPSSKSYSSVSSMQSTNYTGTIRTYTISGYVKTSGGAAISGVSMSGLPGSPSTNSSGNYSATVNYGWSGTVTPTKAGYDFSPSSKSYSSVTSNQTTNYTGTIRTYKISGYVKTSSGSGITGVTMSGLSGSPATSSSGYYSATVNYGWSGTVTPTMNGYDFSPSAKSYSSVTSNQSTNYTGTIRTYTISGYVKTSGGAAISGVSLSGLPGSPSTNSSGYYSATVNYGWSGNVLPDFDGYNFSPSSKSYSNISSNQTTDYTGTLKTYTISGYVKTSDGSAISGVTLSGLSGNPSTNSSGYYSASVDHGWSGSVSPSKDGYDFSPSSKSYSSVSGNQTTDYTGTIWTYTISGNINTSAGEAISGVNMSGLPGNPSTDGNGLYSAIVDYGWSGTVVPVLNGYTFSPSENIYSQVSENMTLDYIGIPDPYFEISLTNITLAIDAGSHESINISSNVDWSITEDLDWISVSPQNGSNNETITITASTENTNTQSRSGVITFEGGGFSHTLTVTQAGTDPVLEISSTKTSLDPEAGSTLAINISSNIAWSIQEAAEWLSVSPESGSGNSVITVTAGSANPETTSRSITVTVTGGGISRDITISQEGRIPNAIPDIFEQTMIVVYPNPASERIFIKADAEINTRTLLRVFDISGRILYEDVLNHILPFESIQVDISRFEVGEYILELNNAKSRKVFKVTKFR